MTIWAGPAARARPTPCTGSYGRADCSSRCTASRSARSPPVAGVPWRSTLATLAAVAASVVPWPAQRVCGKWSAFRQRHWAAARRVDPALQQWMVCGQWL